MRSDLSPIGHVLIPIFFVQIGINAEISAFGKLGVLTDAAILLVIAIIGKVIAAWGKGRAPGDLLLIGFGMIPRGEVGLIFATIGLQNGVLGEDLYAAVLLVVLATTLITPPLLKQRTRTVMERARAAVRSGVGSVRRADPRWWTARCACRVAWRTTKRWSSRCGQRSRPASRRSRPTS
ncbi:MAG: cation:proton antiporter [Acidimicrobiales bacterium]